MPFTFSLRQHSPNSHSVEHSVGFPSQLHKWYPMCIVQSMETIPLCRWVYTLTKCRQKPNLGDWIFCCTRPVLWNEMRVSRIFFVVATWILSQHHKIIQLTNLLRTYSIDAGALPLYCKSWIFLRDILNELPFVTYWNFHVIFRTPLKVLPSPLNPLLFEWHNLRTLKYISVERVPELSSKPSFNHGFMNRYVSDFSINLLLVVITWNAKQKQLGTNANHKHTEVITRVIRITAARVANNFLSLTSTTLGSAIKTMNSDPIHKAITSPYFGNNPTLCFQISLKIDSKF